MKHFKIFVFVLLAFNIFSLLARPSGSTIAQENSTLQESTDSTLRVYFYLDASVMMPKSKETLERVMNFMLENEEAEIYVHGHTNGNHTGPITVIGSANDFFHLDEVHNKSIYGSARKLSKIRAQTVKEYLTTHGIDNKRIHPIAWGGDKMLYTSDGDKQWHNARAEIELVP
ncbi:OmpA family protein [Fulvivirga ligni]|uniref:OmpA family protein n=1 Tax=Fulvivirga ligni TaxID=2904246 RepID=UPI001F30518B|nr:OmpA family protein [Fulvivirga ligni]UII22191.1 OmpA family protein [Fulvivirga ligni]